MEKNKKISKIEKREAWEGAIALSQIDGEYIPSEDLKELIEKEIKGEVDTNEIVKILVEKYTEK